MRGECTVVDCQPGLLVGARLKRPRRDRGMVSRYRERATHLVEVAAFAEATLRRHLVRHGPWFRHPEVDVASSLAGDLAQRGGEKVVSYVLLLRAEVGVDDDLDSPCAMAAAHLGIADEGAATSHPCHETGETRTPAVNEVEPLVLSKGPVLVGPCSGVQ
jgi:hypothetical protein